MTDIDEILSRLSKDTLTKFRMGSDISKDFIPSPSFGLNLVIGGGFPIGKQSTLWGNESAGKSAIALETAAIAQKMDRGVGLVDVEKTFDPVWAAKLGVNVSQFPVSQVSSIGDFADLANDWIKAGMEMIIVDSTSFLMPKSFYEAGELKAFENTGQIGQFARELGQACRMIQGTNFSASMIHISQVRMDLAGFKPGMKASGGKEVGHADSLRIRLFSSKSEDKALKGEVAGIQEVIGRNVTWSIDKNKVNGRYGNGTYGLYTMGDFIGIDRASELLEYGKRYGIVEGSTWLTVYGEKFQGATKATTYIRENPEIAQKLEAEILAKSV